jgi:hypothetical protein
MTSAVCPSAIAPSIGRTTINRQVEDLVLDLEYWPLLTWNLLSAGRFVCSCSPLPVDLNAELLASDESDVERGAVRRAVLRRKENDKTGISKLGNPNAAVHEHEVTKPRVLHALARKISTFRHRIWTPRRDTSTQHGGFSHIRSPEIFGFGNRRSPIRFLLGVSNPPRLIEAGTIRRYALTEMPRLSTIPRTSGARVGANA